MDDQQRNALAERAYKWIRAVRRLNRSGDQFNENPAKQHAEMVESLHLLLIALEQISKHLELLLADISTPFQERGERYLDIWNAPLEEVTDRRDVKLSDARNALEHEAEYIAGGGWFRQLVGTGWSDLNFHGGFVWSAHGIEGMTILGRHYPLRKVISGALDLEEPVAQWLEQRLNRPRNPGPTD